MEITQFNYLMFLSEFGADLVLHWTGRDTALVRFKDMHKIWAQKEVSTPQGHTMKGL